MIIKFKYVVQKYWATHVYNIITLYNVYNVIHLILCNFYNNILIIKTIFLFIRYNGYYYSIAFLQRNDIFRT